MWSASSLQTLFRTKTALTRGPTDPFWPLTLKAWPSVPGEINYYGHDPCKRFRSKVTRSKNSGDSLTDRANYIIFLANWLYDTKYLESLSNKVHCVIIVIGFRKIHWSLRPSCNVNIDLISLICFCCISQRIKIIATTVIKSNDTESSVCKLTRCARMSR